MSIRDTIQIGHPALKAENKEIVDFKDSKLHQVVQDLIDTMRSNELVGMAAPQIGENYKVFVTEPRVTPTRTIDQSDELRIYINPVIVESSHAESVIFEGYGSVLRGTLFGPVKRPRVITIEAFDLDGKKFRLKCDGILARVIQHEYDHLQGVEFTEKVYDYRQLMEVEFYKANVKTSEEQVSNSKISLLEFTPLPS